MYKITIYLCTQSLLHVSANVHQLQGEDNTNEFTSCVGERDVVPPHSPPYPINTPHMLYSYSVSYSTT
jgi:hypothetical protein